jgi:hypothetical protein
MFLRLSVIAALALLTTAADAAPLSTAPLSTAPSGIAIVPAEMVPVETVRLVCDQNCSCWHTAYRARRHEPLLLADDVNACPAGGRYNGHYRTGPSTGLGFESRIAKGSLFPFY